MQNGVHAKQVSWSKHFFPMAFISSGFRNTQVAGRNRIQKKMNNNYLSIFPILVIDLAPSTLATHCRQNAISKNFSDERAQLRSEGRSIRPFYPYEPLEMQASPLFSNLFVRKHWLVARKALILIFLATGRYHTGSNDYFSKYRVTTKFCNTCDCHFN